MIDEEMIKSDLLSLDTHDFYIKYIVKSKYWYFSDYLQVPSDEVLDVLDRFKEIVSEHFHVSFHSLQLVGSTESHVDKLNNFVKLYSIFDNDMDMDGKLSDEEKIVYDMLKKYKLASSEGLNKHTNRMIRYNVLKDFVCDEKVTNTIQAQLYDKIINYATD